MEILLLETSREYQGAWTPDFKPLDDCYDICSTSVTCAFQATFETIKILDEYFNLGLSETLENLKTEVFDNITEN